MNPNQQTSEPRGQPLSHPTTTLSSTHHVLSIQSPEAEIYGFDNKFKENTRQYFNRDQNQVFLDSLAKKLQGQGQQGSEGATVLHIQSGGEGSVSSNYVQGGEVQSSSFGGSSVLQGAGNSFGQVPGDGVSRLHSDIRNGAMNLKKTSHVNDRSAPIL